MGKDKWCLPQCNAPAITTQMPVFYVATGCPTINIPEYACWNYHTNMLNKDCTVIAKDNVLTIRKADVSDRVQWTIRAKGIKIYCLTKIGKGEVWKMVLPGK